MGPTEVMSNQEYTTSRLIIIYRKGSEDFVYGGGEGRVGISWVFRGNKRRISPALHHFPPLPSQAMK